MATERSPGALEAQLRTPEEELAYLRERLSHVEKTLERAPATSEAIPDAPARQLISEYAQEEPSRVLHARARMPERVIERVVLDLAPEAHDVKMAELLAIVQERGVRNALSVVAKLGEPHLEDDSHRFLVEYLKEGYPAKGLRERGPTWKALHKTLFEVTVPPLASPKEGRERALKELVASMEQLYAGMLALGEREHMSFEIATRVEREEATFYVAVPDSHVALFEKQLLSIFPQARLTREKNDYNIFN